MLKVPSKYVWAWFLAGIWCGAQGARDGLRAQESGGGVEVRESAVLRSVEDAASQDAANQAAADEASLIQEIIEPELVLHVDPSRSRIIRTRHPVTRLAITDPGVIDINEFGPFEFELIGLKAGETTLTIWLGEDGKATSLIRYLVKVAANRVEQQRAVVEYQELQARLNELFPYSAIQLIPVADKLVVRGQARDSKEASEILALLGGSGAGGPATGQGNSLGVTQGSLVSLPGAEDLKTKSLVNLLHVPGEQQVMLKVRIAELSRNAARELGLDFEIADGSFSFSHFIGGGGNVTATFDNEDLNFFLRAFSTNGYGKLLAEPNLVTISGQPATFIAGGEFAVPTAVGVGGVGAATTTFRGFGTQLAFTPTVIDKDKIRLQVAPSFSTLNQDNAVNGIPGLNLRSVVTTVDLREGQWLAIAGLMQDEQGGRRDRLPFFGELPLVGAAFGNQNVIRNETELVVLVSPELVHPLEPEQAPSLLPGMEVTEPTNGAFWLLQHIEGNPDMHHRSTVWPNYQQHLRRARWQGVAGGGAVAEEYYVNGPHGYSP